MQEYRNLAVDSTRWSRFAFRSDDVVISTPSKCGTTWMQSIVAMLLLDRVDLDGPIGVLSPWLDARTRSEQDVFALLEAQHHRRFIKTHTPLDGFPRPEGVTVITVIRHPLDVALSFRDHRDNADREHTRRLIAATGVELPPPSEPEAEPDDDAGYLRWWIDRDEGRLGMGPLGLADYCHQVRQYWEARDEPDVALFHYADLWTDLRAEIDVVAAVLGVAPGERRIDEIAEAVGLASMRDRAELAAPHTELGIWKDPASFFRVGGPRPWRAAMTEVDEAHFHIRLAELAGDASDWILRGRAALG